jgi:hypothetical protein
MRIVCTKNRVLKQNLNYETINQSFLSILDTVINVRIGCVVICCVLAKHFHINREENRHIHYNQIPLKKIHM